MVKHQVILTCGRAEHKISALLCVEHIGEILSAHRGGGHFLDQRISSNSTGGPNGEFSRIGIIHRGGRVPGEADIGRCAETCGDAFGQTVHPLLDPVADGRFEPTRGAFHHHVLGDDIVGITRRNRTD